MATGSKAGLYQNAQSASYLPLTLHQRVLFRWTIVRIGFQVWLLLGKGFKGLYLNGFLKIHAFLNIRCPFLVSYLKKKTIWSNMVYIVFIQSYSCSIAVNQLKRKFVMSVITQPFSFWRMFKKAGIFKKPFKLLRTSDIFCPGRFPMIS